VNTKHPVVRLIEDIYSSREIIATLYDSEGEGVLNTDDPATKRQINKLSNLQLLISLHGDSFYLESDFTRLIDKGLRQDTISYLNSDVGNEIKKINHVFETYKECSIKGQISGVRKNERELTKLFIAITQRFNTTAEELFKRVQANYGKMDYGTDRARENKFYQDELEQLKESYHQVDKFLDVEAFQNNPLMINLSISYKGRTMGFFDKVSRTLTLLKEFAYRAREQEIRTEKLRALLDHIETHPTDNFEETENLVHECPVFLQMSNSMRSTVPVQSYPDINNDDFEEAYGSIIEKIRVSSTISESFSREKSSTTPLDPIKRIREQSRADKLLISVMKSVVTFNKPMLASKALIHLGDTNMTLEYWLYFLRKSYSNNRRLGKRKIKTILNIVPILDLQEGYSGNAVMKNVVIAPRSFSNQVLNQHYRGQVDVK
jgi:hypothetical protein